MQSPAHVNPNSFEGRLRAIQREALDQAAHGRRLQVVALRRVLRQLDAGMSGRDARRVIEQEIADHAAELDQIADQAKALQPDRELIQHLVDDVVAEADEGRSHA